MCRVTERASILYSGRELLVVPLVADMYTKENILPSFAWTAIQTVLYLRRGLRRRRFSYNYGIICLEILG